MGYLYTFRYIGNKHRFISQIISILNNIPKTNNFIEVFGGSGVISLNLSKLYDKCILNDINSDVMCIHETFKNAKWEDYVEFMKCTNINTLNLSNKQLFYKFRDNCNKAFYHNDDKKFMKGFFLYYIAGACINSFFRIGPNGFNQSAANQDLSKRINPILWNNYKNAYSNIELSSKDFNEILDNTTIATWFLDPPYFSTSNTYTNNFNKSQKQEFLEKVIELKGNILYTDVYRKEDWVLLKQNGFKIEKLRDNMPNISVGGLGKNENNRIEVIYYKTTL